MATKTISIDLEAYERLKNVQKANESFSQTIKRVVWEPAAFQRVLKRLEKDPITDQAAEAIEQVIASRSGQRSRKQRKSRRVR